MSQRRLTQRRKRANCQSPPPPPPSDDETLRAGVWMGERKQELQDTPRAPPASPSFHEASTLDPMLDDESPALPATALPSAGSAAALRSLATSFVPQHPSPLALSRLSMVDDEVFAPLVDIAPHTGLGSPIPRSYLGAGAGARPDGPLVHRPEHARHEESHAAFRRYSPGVHTGGDLPSGGRPLLRYTMGYREDCELCRNRTPGHYNHIVR